MKTGPSIMYYHMSMLDAPADKQTKVRERLTGFCDVVNSLFKDTGKHIEIKGNKFIINANGTLLSSNDLSSGEKQIRGDKIIYMEDVTTKIEKDV